MVFTFQKKGKKWEFSQEGKRQILMKKLLSFIAASNAMAFMQYYLT